MKFRFKNMKSIFITGATGVMGNATLDAVLDRGDCIVRLLVRDSRKNRKFMRRYMGRPDVEVVWGDLLDSASVERALGDAQVVLHMGGMVSPLADRFPEKSLKVNVEGTRNIVEAIKRRGDADKVSLVYVGSVAQMSNRLEPYHWARTGDPIMTAEFDYYGLSKILAERVVAESGLKRWVSLRQSGILHPGLFLRGSNPITFHVPLRGVLEWTTVEDSGRLMAALCGDEIPDDFWRNFYNIGSGEQYRLSNYEFEKLLLSTTGTPPPEKIFDTDWFATRNFHGCWFLDSDRLNEIVPFRKNIPVEDYFRSMVRKAPWWVRLAPLAPAPLVKQMMRKVARTPGDGTLYWFSRNDCEDKIRAFFGSREQREAIPSWKDFDLSRPSSKPRLLSHGYDEKKPVEEISLSDCREAAIFRGGKCLSESMEKGDIHSPLHWECGFGHRFEATPALVLKGGHWCPDCLPAPWKYEEEAEINPFVSQLLKN